MADGAELARLTVVLDARIAQFEAKVARAEKRLAKGADGMGRSGKRIAGGMDGAAAAAGRLVAAVVSVEAVRRAVTALASSGEQLRTLEARFTALTGSAERAAGLVGGSLGIAAGTGASAQAVGDLVAQFRIAADGVGATDAEVLRFTESLIKLGTIGGASLTEIANGTRQLSQGLAGGVLRAEEFNSVVENTPLIAKALADELAGGSLGALRAMVLEGRVLSSDVFGAILRQTDSINGKFEELPVTMERAANRLSTAMTVFLAQLDDGLGVSRGIAAALESAASFLERLPDIVGIGSEAAGITDEEIAAAGGLGAAMAARAASRAGAGAVRPAAAAPTVAAGGGRAGGSQRDPFADVMQGMERQLGAAALDASTFGMAAGEAQKYRLVLEAIQKLHFDGVAVSDAQRQSIEFAADAIVSQTEALRGMEAAQKAVDAAAQANANAITAIGDAFTQAAGQADTLKDGLIRLGLQLLSMGIQGAFGVGPLGAAFRAQGATIPGFANGTPSAPGGLAMVGERGAELVNLPRGSQVFSAGRTQSMLGGTTIHVDARNADNPAAVEAAARRGAAMALAQVPGVNRDMRRRGQL